MKYRLMISFWIMICLLLSSCSSESSRTATSKKDETLESGQTLNVIEPEVKNGLNMTESTSGEKYQIQTRLTDFHMFNDASGIAWGSTRNELRLYLTLDSGVTWSNISPAENVQFPNSPKYDQHIYFLDMNNGWVVRNATGSIETILLHTVDAGLNWTISSLPETDKVTGIQFVSELVGWVLTSDSITAGQEIKTLYQTIDGGNTWTEMMSSDTKTTEQVSAHALPQSGSATGMVFTSGSHGIISLDQLGIPQLYTTMNRGLDWQENTSFFSKDDFDTCDQYRVGKLSLFAGSTVEGFMSVGCTRGDETKFNGYFTSDAGDTWEFLSFPMSWHSGLNQYIAPTFINHYEGWIMHDASLLHTPDHGQTWIELPRSQVLANVMSEYPEIVKFEFITSKVGWLLVQNNDLKRSLLLQTKDGGVSWRVL